MIYIKLFLKIIPFVIELIKAVEWWMTDEPKSGEAKKAAVMDSIKTIITGWGEVATGGAKDAWERLSPMIAKTVDFLVGLYFNLAK